MSLVRYSQAWWLRALSCRETMLGEGEQHSSILLEEGRGGGDTGQGTQPRLNGKGAQIIRHDPY